MAEDAETRLEIILDTNEYQPLTSVFPNNAHVWFSQRYAQGDPLSEFLTEDQRAELDEDVLEWNTLDQGYILWNKYVINNPELQQMILRDYQIAKAKWNRKNNTKYNLLAMLEKRTK